MKFNELTILKNTYLNKNFEGYTITIENNQWVAKKPLAPGIMDELVPLDVDQIIEDFKDIKGNLQEMQHTFDKLRYKTPLGEIEEYDTQEYIQNCMTRVLIYRYCEHVDLELIER